MFDIISQQLGEFIFTLWGILTSVRFPPTGLPLPHLSAVRRDRKIVEIF
jgi:hypothetical protein